LFPARLRRAGNEITNRFLKGNTRFDFFLEYFMDNNYILSRSCSDPARKGGQSNLKNP
jgi:hypothetical protein